MKQQAEIMTPPFPVSTSRFDQKNEMFKRGGWDEEVKTYAHGYYTGGQYGNKAGFRQLDYAFRFGAGYIEASAGFGNIRSNYGLYAWEGTAPRYKHWLELGGQVKESPEKMTRIIKKVARLYGADLVGICKVHPNWVYSHEYNRMTQEHYPTELPEDCRNAIVIAVSMDYDAMRTSPTSIESAATGIGYSQMAVVASMLAVFIRHLGYKAIPCGNDTALSVPLAMAAGLGEAGRQGILITKKYGPRVRLCKVFTDLPLTYDAYQPFGVTEFCRVCKKCAIHCPSQTIPYDDMTTEGHNISNHSGILKWYSNYEKCFQFWTKTKNDCANCIRVCAFNKPPGHLHDFTRMQIKYLPRLDWLTVKMDDIFGYGKQLKPEKYWDRL